MTRVLLELPADADAVEAPLVSLVAPPPPAAWRRWGWAVALVPTAALLAYQRLAAGRDWPVPSWVAAVVAVGLLATAGLALVRYVDDKSQARDARDRDALIARPRRATGTVIARVPVGGRGGRGRRGREDGRGEGGRRRGAGRGGRGREACTVSFPGPDGTVTRRVVLPLGSTEAGDGPRVGDPVAVWFADDADLELVRYHRDWARDLLAALGDAREGDDATPTGAGEGADRPE